MADPPVGRCSNATSWPERVATSAIPVVLGGAAFAVSFSNVRRVALDHLPAENPGNTEWKSWALAASVELMALGAGLAVRSRRSRGLSTAWAWAVMCVGVVATVAANLETARAPGWGTVVAVWPACAYLLAASLKATRPAAGPVLATGPATVATEPDPPAELHSVPDAEPAEDELLPLARQLMAEAATAGRAIPRTGLAQAIRDAGQAVGNGRARQLWDDCRAEAAA